MDRFVVRLGQEKRSKKDVIHGDEDNRIREQSSQDETIVESTKRPRLDVVVDTPSSASSASRLGTVPKTKSNVSTHKQTSGYQPVWREDFPWIV